MACAGAYPMSLCTDATVCFHVSSPVSPVCAVACRESAVVYGQRIPA